MLFSIPYGWQEPDLYINLLNKYKNNIDSFYFGLPFKFKVSNGRSSFHISEETEKVYDYNTEQVLKLTIGKFKRIALLNAIYYDNNSMQIIKTDIINFLIEFKIEAVTITNLELAKEIKNKIPEIEIHTSCNCFQYSISQMLQWKRLLGDNIVFNPPREAGRMINLLKEMKAYKLKTKVIINESCIFGCQNALYHNINMLSKEDINENIIYSSVCTCGEEKNFLKSNWILPRWIDIVDDYIDIYKISGRTQNIDYIDLVLKSYINKDDNINIFDLFVVGTVASLKNKKYYLPANKIHDKLMYCECKDCEKCNKCDILFEKVKNGCFYKDSTNNNDDWENIYNENTINPIWGAFNVPTDILSVTLNKYKKDYNKILDIGCGNGRNSLLFDKTKYVGIDISESAIDFCNEVHLEYKFEQCDFFNHNGKYDAIIDCTFFHTINPKNRLQYKNKIDSILNKNGILTLLNFYSNKDNLPCFKLFDLKSIYEWGINDIQIKRLFNNYSLLEYSLINKEKSNDKNCELDLVLCILQKN